MKKITKAMYLGITSLFFMFCLFLPKSAEAATPKITGWLKENKIYSSYDLDGNKKKDRIQLKTNWTGSKTKAMLYINGKNVYTLSNGMGNNDGAYFRILTLKNGKNFIDLLVPGPNPGCDKECLLQYSNGKIKLVEDFGKILSKSKTGSSYLYGYPNAAIRISGNSVYVRARTMTWTLGLKEFAFRYDYKNGTLKRAEITGIISEACETTESRYSYIALKQFSVYKSTTNKTKVFNVKTGERVTVGKYYLTGTTLWLQIKNSAGKTGWIKADTTPGPGCSLLFKNAYYSN